MDSVSHSYQRLQISHHHLSAVVLSDTALHQIMSSLCGNMIAVVIAISTIFVVFRCYIVMS